MKNLETLIQELCPDGVEFVKLGDVCKISRGKVYSKKYLAEHIGEYPVYSSQTANDGILGKIGTYDCDGKFLTWTTDGAYAGTVFYRQGKFSVTNVCGLISCSNPFLSLKFLYYWLTIEAPKHVHQGMGNPKLMSNQMAKIEIPLPPIDVQTEIVRILDKFTSLEAELEMELEAELDCRKRQYEYYRDKLLSFDNVGGQEVEWKKMSEVCLKTSKINWKLVEGEYKYIDLSSVDRDNHKISDFTIINKENAPSRAQQVVKTGDILFGTTRPTLMRFCYIPKEYDGEVCSTGYCVIRVNNEMINSHFAYHFLFTQKFQDYVEGHQKGASYPAISNKDVMSFELPIPSLQEQERIATILDRFESLTTSLQSGLPAEIAARRQQYEHYRDKLLTFKRKGAA